MTISNTTYRWPYTGDGSTIGFAYNNKIFQDSDLDVYVDGSLQTLSTDYTISGAGNESGGTVTFVTAPANGASVVIIRGVPFDQEADLPDGGALPTSSIEDGLDKLTILVQQLQEELSRAPRFNPGTIYDVSLDDPVANYFLRYGSAANTIEPVSQATLTDDDGNPIFTTDDFYPRFDSVAALIAAQPDSSAIRVTSYYGGWAATVAGPKGGFWAHKTGATNLAPTNGTAVSVSEIGGGDGTGSTTGQSTQAGYFWDASGAEWKLSKQLYTAYTFGAYGNGSNDDSTALNDGSTFLNTEGGGRLLLEEGSFLVDSTVTAKSNVYLEGLGDHSQILIGTAGIDAVTMQASGSNIHIKNLRITGTSPAGDSNEKAIFGDTVSDFQVQNCTIEKVNYGIKPDTCSHGDITHCRFNDTTGTTQGTAVLLGDDPKHIIITDNTFKDIGFHCVYLSVGATYCTVGHNVMDTVAEAAINMNTLDTQNVTAHNTITDNTMTGLAKSGIYIVGFTQHNTISLNKIYSPNEYGIRIEGNASYALTKQPIHNDLIGNEVYDPTLSGIEISNGSDNTIEGGRVTGGAATGYVITTSGSDTSSYSYRNKITGVTSTGNDRGLSLSGNTDGTKLDSSNSVYSNTTNDYYLISETNTEFEEQFLKDNSDYSTSGTGADTLATTTAPAYYLGQTGGFRITAAGTKTGTAGNKTVEFSWDGLLYTFHAAANDENDWRLEIEIINTANNAQRISYKGWNGTTMTQGYETATKNTEGDRTMSLVGTCANGADTITQTMFLVERV